MLQGNKVIPEKEAYSTPNNVKEEINEQITEIEKTVISYEITDSDLNIYKKSSDYKPGKPDPFSLVETTSGSSNSGNTTGNSNTNNTNQEKNETTNANSTGTFFNDEGIK